MSSESAEPIPNVPFLVTASELKDRRNKRRLATPRSDKRSEATRRILEMGLKGMQ